MSSVVVIVYTTIFNIKQLYMLPKEGIYMVCIHLRTNSDYFPLTA